MRKFPAILLQLSDEFCAVHECVLYTLRSGSKESALSNGTPFTQQLPLYWEKIVDLNDNFLH